ncbi:MAG: hypothetical protein ABEJ23_04275 [Haloarculaceae archaeon]
MKTLQSTVRWQFAPVSRLRDVGVALVEGAAFWAAVLLPFCALALLVARSVSPAVVSAAPPWSLLGGVLAANVVALLVGHRHRRTHAD